MLTWLYLDTSTESIYLYDSPSSQTYPVAFLRSFYDEDILPFVSSRGGITIHLYDNNRGNNKATFLAHLILTGIFNKSTAAMYQ